MGSISQHTFHIPVMGLAFTVDSPLKVARFGITSVVSIGNDELVEDMRKCYSEQEGLPYERIGDHDEDPRARRITAYLNRVKLLVQQQTDKLRAEPFEEGRDICKYFELLPSNSEAYKRYETMLDLPIGPEKAGLQALLRDSIVPGAIDVNIMTKVDKTNYDSEGKPLPPEFSDAMAALRGFASSDLEAAVVFSAGLNPRLYSYCESFPDFFPQGGAAAKKTIILKVSDFRSALVQGKFLAKKGLWISEFRVESGLNCGGHAFASEGMLMAPILEEFREKKESLRDELFEICQQALTAKGFTVDPAQFSVKISAQGGVGTANEHLFLLEHFGIDSVGWGSPFLLVPEATTVDDETLAKLAHAKPEDYYLSNSSPLGVPFNNLRDTSADQERRMKIEKGRPGSPCYNKHLSFNSEFTEQPICTASRLYQDLKIKQIRSAGLPEPEVEEKIKAVEEKECICAGLATSAYLNHHLTPPHNRMIVSICPGPNLAYFSGTHSLRSMADHIYGRTLLLNQVARKNFFVNELRLNMDFLKEEIAKSVHSAQAKQMASLKRFKENLLTGIDFCRSLAAAMTRETESYRKAYLAHLDTAWTELQALTLPEPQPMV